MSYNNIRITKTRRKKELYIGNTPLKEVIIYSSVGLFTFLLVFVGFIYVKFIKPLPPITQLESQEIKEASTIFDRNGKQLYIFGDEKRTYVGYDQISKNMLNAIVSGEDKTFYENDGYDLSGLARAVLYRISGKTTKLEGTSTISQQLIKISFLSNERSLERKIKEFYLSNKMNSKYSKEKILELYLNKISYGSNAYGIEQASLTFFGKKAKELSILEASILASLPKGPTYYSPYNHYDRLVGYLYAYPKNDEANVARLITKDDLNDHIAGVSKYVSFIAGLKAERLGENGLSLCGVNSSFLKNKYDIDSSGCTIMKYSDLLTFLNSIRIDEGDVNIEYQTGRKDFILGRMLEDEKISFDDYKLALTKSVGLEFKQYVENIKYPHFVLYVKEYLTQKYGEELISGGGLKVYTTLDATLQDKAQEIVKKQAAANKAKFNANNAALVSMDNKTGDILAFVGGADYFDKSIDGNVNMITSKRQPGSTFKPFVYALAVDKKAIGPYTPIYDLKTEFPGKYEPKNFDGKFNGKMTLMTALNYSRNIPAIKAYYLAGGQNEIINYMNSAGVKSLSTKADYGAPLALGAGEITPLELLQAYSVFPNGGKKVEVNPVLKILDSKGVIIEQKRVSAGTQVLDEATAYIMDFILSNAQSRPNQYWNNFLTLNGRTAGAKTGTSNKLFVKNGVKQYFPGDLWTAGFTPQITTVVWAGNTNGKQIDTSGDGLNGAGSIWKEYMEFAHKDKKAEEFTKPASVKYASISKISGLLAPAGFDTSFVVNSMFKNVPTKYDNSLKEVEVDSLCNGKVSDFTPESAIKKGYYIALHDIDPTNATWEKSVQEWIKGGYAEKEFSNYPNIITNYKEDEECSRDATSVESSSIEVKSNIQENDSLVVGGNAIEISFKSNNPIKKIQILLSGKLIGEMSEVDGKKSGTFKGTITIPEGSSGEYNLTIRVLDNILYSGEETKKIMIGSKESTPPTITITNPEKGSISLYEGTFFNLRGKVEDRSAIKSINIYIDGKPYEIGIQGKEFVSEINRDASIKAGNHTITVEAVDNYFNKSQTNITLEVLPK